MEIHSVDGLRRVEEGLLRWLLLQRQQATDGGIRVGRSRLRNVAVVILVLIVVLVIILLVAVVVSIAIQNLIVSIAIQKFQQ
jgi:hypothetical protein